MAFYIMGFWPEMTDPAKSAQRMPKSEKLCPNGRGFGFFPLDRVAGENGGIYKPNTDGDFCTTLRHSLIERRKRGAL